MQQTVERQMTSEAMSPAMKVLGEREKSDARIDFFEREAARPEARVLMNHIYEYKKGVRRMILFTCNRRFEAFATNRLCRQSIDYVVQPAGKENVNVYFGRKECLDAIRLFVTRPLNELSPEEDFILGAMLGYDICAQCERYCERKGKCKKCQHAQ